MSKSTTQTIWCKVIFCMFACFTFSENNHISMKLFFHLAVIHLKGFFITLIITLSSITDDCIPKADMTCYKPVV